MNSAGRLIRTRQANISKIRMVRPSLTLHRNADGQLNIAPLLNLFADRPERPERTEPIGIPDIAVVNGDFVYRNDGKAPLEVRGVHFTVE
jgi:uncharacterized protein involved in outer membrane biogenesis